MQAAPIDLDKTKLQQNAARSPVKPLILSYIQAAPIELDETERYSRTGIRNSFIQPVGPLNSVSCGQWQLHRGRTCLQQISSPCGLQVATGLCKICTSATVKCLQFHIICTFSSFSFALVQLYSFFSFLFIFVHFQCQAPAAL